MQLGQDTLSITYMLKTSRHREEAAGCPFYHPSLTLVAHFHHVCGISLSAHECLLSYVFTLCHDHTVKLMFVIFFCIREHEH